MAALWKALNKYTEHDARLITFKQTYLNYETDLLDPTFDQVNELVEWAEFFVLGEMLNPRMHTNIIIERLCPNNCIIRAGGTIARNYPQLYMDGKFRGIMKTGAYHDPTIASRIFPMGNTVNMYDFSEWPVRVREVPEGIEPIRIVFSGTAQKHQADHCAGFPKALDMLHEEYGDRIEFVNIQNTSWRECLKIKADCDICFDQFLIGTYANSAIEAMFYRQAAFCYISGWSKSVFPEAPLISVTNAQEIFDEIILLIDNYPKRVAVGKIGNKYALQVHGAWNAVDRWSALIDFVVNEF